MSESTSFYPAVSFYFSVEVNGSKYAFKEVSGLEVELEVEEIKGGGNNLFNYRAPSRTKYNNLILKRGVLPDGVSDSNLYGWVKDMVQDNSDGVVTTKDIQVSLLEPKGGGATTTWSFRRAYPVKWKFSDLNGEDSSVAIETIEFAYESFSIS